MVPLVFFCAVTLVGCTSNKTHSGAETPTGVASDAGVVFHQFSGMLDEFHGEAATLTLPEGVSWIEPLDPGEELLPNGKRGAPSYEEGYGVGTAGNQWFCFWIDEWLTQRGVDATAEAEALAKMNSYIEVRSFVEYADPGSTQPYIIDLLQKATLGDPSIAVSYDENNCSQWLAKPTAAEAAS